MALHLTKPSITDVVQSTRDRLMRFWLISTIGLTEPLIEAVECSLVLLLKQLITAGTINREELRKTVSEFTRIMAEKSKVAYSSYTSSQI